MSLIGTIIKDQYEVRDELLHSHFSELYKVLDNKTQRSFVMRAFHDGVQVKTDRQRKACQIQIKLEGNLLSHLAHKHLPKVLKVIEEDKGIFLLMNYFDGITLNNYLKKRGSLLDENTLQNFFIQFIRVIRYLHEQNPPVVNGGLEPSGIIVASGGQIKLAEFAMTRIGQSNPTGKINFRVLSSKNFTAPEQLRGSAPDPRDDIYSFGAIMYYLATGLEPKPSISRKRGSDKNITDINPDISPLMQEIIFKMMDPDPSSRYMGIRELEEDYQTKFPLNFEASVAVPDLMHMLSESPETTAQSGSVYLTGITDSTSESAAFADAVKTDDPKDLEKELGLETIEDEDEKQKIKKKFEVARLLHHSFWFGSSQSIKHTPDFTTPGESFLAQYPSIELTKTAIQRDIAQIIPKKSSKVIYGVIVGKGENEDELIVAVKDPSNVHIYDQIAFATKGKYKPLLYRADPNMIDLAIEYVYSMPAGTQGVSWLEWLEKKKYEHEEIDIKQDAIQVSLFGKDEIDGPIIEEANRIIKEAISIGASDIHLETFEESMIVRYRVDGVLHTINSFPTETAKAIIKRVKITANMDIAKERITQGGRISVKVADREFDLRVSIIPVPNGESVVMRLLNKGAFNFDLMDLGFRQDSLDTFRGLLSKPHGMILVSGPTGSGKSTTLYASLKEINRPDRKLLTVEDPIEYEMPGICQVQVNLAPKEEDQKVTFSKALREFLRQDPDVILVGEIRDPETAAISVQAALTGHLLLSTIHTNDAIGIVTRLRDMGVAPYLIGSVIVGGIAQRLVRRICDSCKTKREINQAELMLFKSKGIPVGSYLAEGKGCLNCHDVGYKGRMGIYELFTTTPLLAEMIALGKSAEELRKIADKEGMKDLLYDALYKAAKGSITIEEVKRVTML